MRNAQQITASCGSSDEPQLMEFLRKIGEKFDAIDTALKAQNACFGRISSKVEKLTSQLDDLKDRVYQAEAPALSECGWGHYVGVEEAQLDLDEKNFDKAWALKHYKVDCPSYDQPLPLDELRSLGCDIGQQEYSKYVDDVQKPEAVAL